jgi:hypothetical protein
MTRDQLKKRLVKVEGKSLRPYVPPRSEMRRESSNVPNVREDDIKFDDFFDFEEDLSEIEAARKQFERIEEEKLNQDRHKPLNNNFDDVSDVESDSSFVLDFEPDPNELKQFAPKQDVIPAKAIISDLKKDIKFCKFIKEGSEKCKRAAMNESDYCHSHKRFSTQEQTINK